MPNRIDPVLGVASDPEARKLALGFPEDTPANRRTICRFDPQFSQSCFTVASVILGGSLDSDIPDLDFTLEKNNVVIESGPQADLAKRIVVGFFDDMNERHEDLNAYVQATYMDNVEQGFSMYRNLLTKDREYNLDVARLDPATIEFYEESSHGWTWFVQNASADFMSKKEFFANLPEFGAFRNGTTVWMKYDDRYFEWMRLFPYSAIPATPLMPLILHKMALIWYIHYSAQKELKPPRILKIGDTKNNVMPQTKAQWKWDMEQAMKLFMENETGDFVIPGYWEYAVEQASRASMDDLVKELNYIDELIGVGVGLPLGLLRQTGVRLSTDNVLREVWLQRIQSFRRNYRSILKHLCEKVLLPANNLSGYRVKIDFPPLSSDNVLTKAQAAFTLAQSGLWKNGDEARKFLRTSIESIRDEPANVPYDKGQIAGLSPISEPQEPTPEEGT